MLEGRAGEKSRSKTIPVKKRKLNLRILAPAVVVVLAWTSTAQAYIGPGAGFAVMGSFLAMFAAIFSAVVALFTWPIRYVIRAINKAPARLRQG